MNKGTDIKPHIGIFGRRNNGKSSIINALAGQEISIVSDVPGTTTDPVKKSIEIPSIGPCIIIDTAGIDDTGILGNMRVSKTMEKMKSIDLAIIVITNNKFGDPEKIMIEEISKYDVPYFFIHNKSDIENINKETTNIIKNINKTDVIDFSTKTKENTDLIFSTMARMIPENSFKSNSLLGDIIKYGDLILLITPIDVEAPEGRLILPQVQAIRDILDNDCIAVVAKEREIDTLIKKLQPRPALVITDSQVFPKADAAIPKDIPLTSFSIMLARYKGDFENYIKGTPHISKLKDGDRVLLLESCTHQVSCDDIGRVKIPRWISNFTGKKIEFDIVSGLSNLNRDIKEYAMVIQCGGCMITKKQLINRLKPAVDAGIPVSNYGMTIAYIHGIYNRAIAPFVKSSENNINYI